MCLSRTASEQRLADQQRMMAGTTRLHEHVQTTPRQHETTYEQAETSARESKKKLPPSDKELSELLAMEPPDEEVRTRNVPPHFCVSHSAAVSRDARDISLNSSLRRVLGSQEDNTRLQWREFGLIYVAYMGFLLSRKNYGFWLRPVISELGYPKGQAGLLGSTLEVTYGTCSFLNGVVIDSRSPKHLLIGGLLLSALLNLSVASTDSLPIMITLWGLNGAVQSVGWPSVTNIFLAWFPDPATRGAWYSLLSTCQNAGAALVPLLVSASVSSYGWRAALTAPAAASVCVALLLAATLYGSPSAVASARDGMATPVKAKAKPADLAHTMREQVFLNPKLWLMAVSYFGCSMVRTCLQVSGEQRRARAGGRATPRIAPLSLSLSPTPLAPRSRAHPHTPRALPPRGVRHPFSQLSSPRPLAPCPLPPQDWTSLYLMESKGLSIAAAARCLFLWELGGFGGTFIAGAISDRAFQGRRGPVVCVCCALLAPSLLVLLGTNSSRVAQLCYLWLGLCAFPVHVLLGLFSREVVPPSVSTTAGGFVKMIAQIGGASAGYPLGRLQQTFGWEGVFSFLALVALSAALAALPLWSTTAAVRIQARNGTVQDFKAMGRKDSAKDLSYNKAGDLSKLGDLSKKDK